MYENQIEFLKQFFPETVSYIQYTQINLDNTDLSIADILRNLNTLYPLNSKIRMQIEDGITVIGILCKSDTIEPYNGIFLFVGKEGMKIKIASSRYIVLFISEDKILDEDGIIESTNKITDYLIKNYSGKLDNLSDLYKKYIYNESELYDDDNYYIEDDENN